MCLVCDFHQVCLGRRLYSTLKRKLDREKVSVFYRVSRIILLIMAVILVCLMMLLIWLAYISYPVIILYHSGKLLHYLVMFKADLSNCFQSVQAGSVVLFLVINISYYSISKL